jgi:hypothetical protein
MTAINQNQPSTAPGDQIVWGAREIGKAIGRSEKAAFIMLEQGKLARARKVAGRWAFNPAVFFATFDGAAS